MVLGKGWGPNHSCNRMTAWHTCRAAELQDVDGYVFQESSMSPSTSNLQMRNKLQVLSFLGPSPSAHPQPLHGHSLGMRSSLALPPPPPRVSQPVPEQVCEPTCRRGPQEVGQRVEIPDVELVVERTAEADTNEVGGEEGRNYLYAVVKAKGRSRRGRRWGGGVGGQRGSKAEG